MQVESAPSGALFYWLISDALGNLVRRGNPFEQRLYDLLKDARQTRSLRQWASWV
ncbi:MAG: hypothetical protein NZ874_08550 [Fimbriimonadales bacterium]|nr:hypothetical protein [Fimbriimonadales bacterium]